MKLVSDLENSLSARGVFHHSQVIPSSLLDMAPLPAHMHAAWADGRSDLNHLAGILPGLYSTFGPRQKA